MASNPIEESCERVSELVSLRVFRINWDAKKSSEENLNFGCGGKNRDGEIGRWMSVCG